MEKEKTVENTLYPWQEECLRKWFQAGCRGMVQAATGSGKTRLALQAAGQLDEKLGGRLLVRIVVPTGALLLQWNRVLREFLTDASGKAAPGENGDPGNKIGLRGGGRNTPGNRKYMIYVINSARYELARQILSELREGKHVLLIADECHHYTGGKNQLIFEFLPYIREYEARFYSLGLSATLPSGEAGQYLSAVLGRKIYSYKMSEAAGRTVCPYDIYHIGLSLQKEEREEYEVLSSRMQVLYRRLQSLYPSLKTADQKARFEMLGRIAGEKGRRASDVAAAYLRLTYKRKSLVCLARTRISCVLELIQRLPAGERLLVFGERIRQAEELYRVLKERYPGRVGRYHSGMGVRANKNTLERFRDGELRILIACKSVDEGVDLPDAAVGIVLSGTSAGRQRIQRLGRLVRRAEGKERAVLYYLHVTDTSEETCYLPGAGEGQSFDLEYDFKTREFSNPPYDLAAERFLEELWTSGAEEAVMEEARRCLSLGQVRGDWLPGRHDVAKKIRTAENLREKNYWVCMKRLGGMARTSMFF